MSPPRLASSSEDQIVCLGLSHHTSPVELRERLNYSPAALQAALARLGDGREECPGGIAELAILSTCNRLELYARTAGPAAPADGDRPADVFSTLVEFIAETRGLPAVEFEPHVYRHTGRAAVEHLCRVAAGLDSMILGEPQILGQVAEAHEAALGSGASGPALSALFRAAIRAGKRARAETAISRNPASLGSVAVRLAEAVVGDLAAARTLIVGAGAMAELAAEALRARGVRHLTLINRTHDRAVQLAQRWGGVALTFERLPEALAEADIVVSSTGAPHVILTADLVGAAMARRPQRPLILVDIAVPRDVDPEVSRIAGAHRYDIDDLQSYLDGVVAGREQAIPRVEAIVAEEAGKFAAWLPGLEMAPVIADLRARADAIRRTEVDKTLRHLPRLDPAERQRIEALAEALINKLLHDPVLRLKAEAGSGRAPDYAAVVRHLFALDG